MKHLKKLGLASALALVATCGVVSSASATLVQPGNTAFTLTSTNSALAISGGGTVACTTATISGTTPTLNPTVWVPITNTRLTYSGCTALGFVGASVTPSAGCNTPATAPWLLLQNLSGPAKAMVTLPSSGCSIDVNIPVIGCTLTIPGNQTIGNGTAGSGGIQWTNLPTSVAHINAAAVPSVVSNGVGFGCATAGAHTGTLTGTYNRSSTTNITVTL